MMDMVAIFGIYMEDMLMYVDIYIYINKFGGNTHMYIYMVIIYNANFPIYPYIIYI